MKLIEIVDSSKVVYLIPIGDVHIGSKRVDYEKLKGYIQWVRDNPAYVFLMGDIFDVSTLESRTSPFDQELNLNEAMEYAKELFFPIKHKIIGAITGNHEIRLEKYAGFNPLAAFCSFLSITYAGYSAVLRFRIGRLPRKSGYTSPRVEYIFYAHHSTGGGTTTGGKINRAERLINVFQGADCYLIGHNHSRIVGESGVFYLSKSGNGKATIQYKKIFFLDCGSYLCYEDSYAEMKMLSPCYSGSPRIRLDGTKKDLHISF